MANDAFMNKLASEMARGVAPDLFEHEMYTNSKVLGRESGINVIIGGDKAQTDGKTVILPALDKSQIVSNEAANVARGFVNHESAHLRFTNGYTVQRFKKHEKHMAFLNGMEDVRIEKTFSQQYPGSQEQFTQAANATLKRFIGQVEKGEIKIDDKSKLVPMATAWAGRRKMGQAVDTKVMAKLEDLVGSENMKVAEYLADESLKATGTLDIARFIENWLGKVDPETEREKQQHKDKGGMAPGAGGGLGEGEGDGSGDGTGKGAPPEWTPGSAHGFFDPSMADAVQDMLPTGEAGRGYVSFMEEDVVWDNFEKYMTPKDGKRGGAMEASYSTMPDTKLINDPSYSKKYLLHQCYYVPGGPDLRKLGLQNVEYMKTHLGPSVRAVKQALERGLIVAKQRNWDPGQTRGNLDPKRLATVLTGSRNFYRRRSELEMIDTAVTLLIDMSGSMNGDKAVEAMRAAYVFAESLTKVGVPIEVLGFSSGRLRVSNPSSARSGIIDMPVYKKFTDSIQHGMWKVGLSANATQNRAGGNNPDGDALLHAWRRLRGRPEPRKVLITFSDGCPAESGWGDERKHLKRVVNMLTVQGCECVGIGIMDSSVETYYPQCIVIHNATELATKAGEFLRNLLIPEQLRVKRARKELKTAA